MTLINRTKKAGLIVICVNTYYNHNDNVENKIYITITEKN